MHLIKVPIKITVSGIIEKKSPSLLETQTEIRNDAVSGMYFQTIQGGNELKTRLAVRW